MVRRTLNYLSFVPSAVWRGLRIGRVDVIVATSPQFFCAMAGDILGALTRTPWVFEVRDLWPHSIRAVGAVSSSLALGMLEKLELAMYRHASRVVCVARPFVDDLARRGIDPAKLVYVPNGVQPEAWGDGNRAPTRAELGLGPDDVLVSYVGTIGMAHGLGHGPRRGPVGCETVTRRYGYSWSGTARRCRPSGTGCAPSRSTT